MKITHIEECDDKYVLLINNEGKPEEPTVIIHYLKCNKVIPKMNDKVIINEYGVNIIKGE